MEIVELFQQKRKKKYLHRDRDALAADRERRSRGLPFRATLLAALRAETYEIH